MYQEISDMNVGSRSVTANIFFAGFTSPVDIDEDEKEFITAVAEQLERKLSDSFFELGNLNQDTLTSNLLSGPKLNGTSEYTTSISSLASVYVITPPRPVIRPANIPIIAGKIGRAHV